MNEIKKWGIYLANLDPVVGSEQGKTRPVLVISEDDINQLLNCVNVLPITSYKPDRTIYPNEVFLDESESNLPNSSIILCHQIRTIDKKRLVRFYGEISDLSLRNNIFDALCFQLGI